MTVTPMAGAPANICITFTFNNILYGISPEGKIGRLQSNHTTWADTGLTIPAITPGDE